MKNAFTYYFTSDHPLYDSHATIYIQKNSNQISNSIGVTLPCCDQGDPIRNHCDQEYYCCTMLALFKPWQTDYHLKKDSNITCAKSPQKTRFNPPKGNSLMLRTLLS